VPPQVFSGETTPPLRTGFPTVTEALLLCPLYSGQVADFHNEGGKDFRKKVIALRFNRNLRQGLLFSQDPDDFISLLVDCLSLIGLIGKIGCQKIEVLESPPQ